HQKGSAATVKYVFHIFLKAAIPFIGLLVPIAFFRVELLELIYGNSYVDYAFVLLAFCGIYILIFIGTQLRFLIRTFERNSLIFWSYVATSILGLTTANFFVTHYQIHGVLAGIALTQIIMVGFYLFALKSELKWLVK
ncbi:MAG: O-antigen/teichoic acid export membrane protein, partial [Salibacteraceae bacterium]